MDKQKIFNLSLKAFLFLSPLFYFRQYHISFARGLFFVLGTFALFAISLSLEPKRRLSNIWISVFLLLALINIFFRGDFGPKQEWFNFWFSCSGFIYVLCGVLLFKIVYCYADKIERYFKPIIFVCLVNLILVAAQLSGRDFMWTNTPSLCGFMENPSQLGQYSAMSIPVLLFIHPILALIPLFTLIVAKSISPMVACAAGMLFWWGFVGRNLKIKAGVGIILILLGLLNFGYIKVKFACRPVMWQKTLKSALQKPYLGNGYMSFNDKVLGTPTKGDLGGTEYSRSHNDYLHTAQELGFPILICLAMFFIGLVKKFKLSVKDKLNMCLASSVLIVLINMSGQTEIRYASISGTFIILLSLLCVKLEEKNDQIADSK